MLRKLALLGPWIAVGVLLWREQTLEQAIAEFVATAHDTVQRAVTDLAQRTDEMLAHADTGRLRAD